MKPLWWIVIVLGVIIIVLLGVLFFYSPAKAPEIPSGVPGAASSTPAAALAPVVSSDGRMAVTSLHPGDLVASPFTVAGTVTGGGWFFEGTFPVKVLDGNGTMIGSGVAQAQGEWTTTATVPFAATVSFGVPQYATGTIVLSRDNPSGDPKNDLSLAIPVRFK